MKTEETILIIVVVLAVIFLFNGFSGAGINQGGMMGMMSGAYGFNGMWIFGWLFMTLIIIVLVLFIVWLIKQIQKK